MTYKTNFRAVTWLGILALAVLAFVASLTSSIGLLQMQGIVLFVWIPFCYCVATVIIDLTLTDLRAANFFGTYETAISLQARLIRNLFLIVYPQIAIVTHILSLRGGDDNILSNSSFFIMTSAIFATTGWLYTSYMASLNIRAQATIAYLGGQYEKEELRLNERALRKFVQRASKGSCDDIGQYVFSKEDIDNLTGYHERITIGDTDYHFRKVCSFILSRYEYLGLAVRTGNFDFGIVSRQKRRQLLGYYNTLINVILLDSDAMKMGETSKFDYRKGSDRWENFIWLGMALGGMKKVEGEVNADTTIDLRRIYKVNNKTWWAELDPIEPEAQKEIPESSPEPIIDAPNEEKRVA